jgi:hypothetical protein
VERAARRHREKNISFLRIGRTVAIPQHYVLNERKPDRGAPAECLAEPVAA